MGCITSVVVTSRPTHPDRSFALGDVLGFQTSTSDSCTAPVVVVMEEGCVDVKELILIDIGVPTEDAAV
jgi:hypothetical protein